MKILIAGAGVMGLSCAWRLAGAGASVEVLDPRPAGGGSTHAALGALWPISPLAKSPLAALDRASLWRFEEFAAQLAEESGLPVSYRRGGRMEILNSAKAAARARLEAEAANREWPAFGGNKPVMEVLDFAASREVNPGLAPFAHGALLCRATAQVRVNELIAALAKACAKKGVTFHQGVSLTGLIREGARISGIETSAGKMFADALLIAAGAWTPGLCPELAAVAPITPAKGQGIAFAMPTGNPLTNLIKAGYIYVMPWPGEILVGATTEPEAGFDEKPTAEAREKLFADAVAVVPDLAHAQLLRHWAGLRPATANNQPVMGPVPGAAGLFLCAGHYKTGIGLSPLVSELISRMILENVPPPELTPFLPANQRLRDMPSPANS